MSKIMSRELRNLKAHVIYIVKTHFENKIHMKNRHDWEEAEQKKKNENQECMLSV